MGLSTGSIPNHRLLLFESRYKKVAIARSCDETQPDGGISLGLVADVI